jgi:xanthine dehydrogenase YagS FAD-binding subunit
MKQIEFAKAKHQQAAVEAVAQGWKPKAGGIDILDQLKERTEESDRVVSLQNISAMKGVLDEGNTLRIGALPTLRDLARHPLITEHQPGLAHAAGDAATPQIRAVATVGGNILQRPRCWYYRNIDYPCLKKGGHECYAVEGENHYHAVFGGGPCHIVHPSNLAPVLVAVGAMAYLESVDGTREVPFSEFFVLPEERLNAEARIRENEILTHVSVPKNMTKSAYVELRHKQSFDWPLAACAVAHDGEKWSLVLGAVAPIPWIPKDAVEYVNKQKNIVNDTATRAGQFALNGAEPMTKNEWRLALVSAAVRRALLKANGIEVEAL